jgi:hypothetical protein
MSLSFTQQPATCSLAQSPIVFGVLENGGVLQSSSFQYLGELKVWNGVPSDSGSGKIFTLAKYPNASSVGLFDFGKIINSSLSSSLEDNPSNVIYYKADFYTRYKTGSLFVTSAIDLESNDSFALDGYSLYGENITQSLSDKTSYFPILTDGVDTQYYFDSNTGTGGVLIVDLGETSNVDSIVYSSGSITESISIETELYPNTSGAIVQVPLFPSEEGFPITASVDQYTITAYSGVTPISSPLLFTQKCESKYPNVRMKWKNRYGQFDYFNFDMVSKKSFDVSSKSYQPQPGGWNNSVLTYTDSDSTKQNFATDAFESITVNTDWISESYNDWFKQLLVSDEIYIIEDTDIRVNLKTTNLEFKTGVVDKLIQYTFDLEYSRTFKLVL